MMPTEEARFHQPRFSDAIAMIHPDQNLSSETCQLSELPPRFYLSAIVDGNVEGLPPQFEGWILLAEPDKAALELAARSNLGRAAITDADIEHCPWVSDDDDVQTSFAALSYACGFASEELPEAISALRDAGLRELLVHSCWVELPEVSNPFFDGGGIRQRDYLRYLDLKLQEGAAGAVELEVVLLSCISLPLHLPECEWPSWAIESKAMLEAEYWDDKEQHWVHIRDLKRDELELE